MASIEPMEIPWSNPASKPIDDVRPIKVICIGAGISGMLAAIRLPQKIKNLDLVIYEKNDDIGGTWHENRYPGVACDIPAHTYQFSFANNPQWSQFYASGGEIQRYLKNVAKRYDVMRYVKLQHKFVGARWQKSSGKWQVEVKDLQSGKVFQDEAEILIKATGILNTWRWPDIPGLGDFKGTLLHSANRDSWDPPLDLRGKRIAVIGGGSSGIQIVPQLQPTAARIDHYMKGKTWISPVGYGSDNAKRGVIGNYKYSEEELKRFREIPDAYLDYRREIERSLNSVPLITFKGTHEQKEFLRLNDESMKQKLAAKPYIYESLRPSFPPFCRRLTPGPGYLEALVQDNVDFIGCGIETVIPNGIKGNDRTIREVDVIICATGYDTSMIQEVPITGLDNVTLGDAWNPSPEAYFSICVPKLPNFYLYFGPNGGPGSGSAILFLENVTDYIIQCIEKIQREYIKSMTVTQEATDQFIRHVDSYFDKTVFKERCKSWFKRNIEDGRVVALWPGASIHARKAMEHVRYQDFIYEYDEALGSNPMSYLGNGMTYAQKEDEDTTEYLSSSDIPPPVVKGVNLWEELDGTTLTNGAVNGFSNGL